MAEVVVGDNESFESAMRRFMKKVQLDGILREARQRQYYEKPSVKRKKKEAAKRRKSQQAEKKAAEHPSWVARGRGPARSGSGGSGPGR
jgi:small subunit ribosomal protein S21